MQSEKNLCVLSVRLNFVLKLCLNLSFLLLTKPYAEIALCEDFGQMDASQINRSAFL